MQIHVFILLNKMYINMGRWTQYWGAQQTFMHDVTACRIKKIINSKSEKILKDLLTLTLVKN